jgi:hypothetical protein
MATRRQRPAADVAPAVQLPGGFWGQQGRGQKAESGQFSVVSFQFAGTSRRRSLPTYIGVHRSSFCLHPSAFSLRVAPTVGRGGHRNRANLFRPIVGVRSTRGKPARLLSQATPTIGRTRDSRLQSQSRPTVGATPAIDVRRSPGPSEIYASVISTAQGTVVRAVSIFLVEIGHGVWYQEGTRIQGPGAGEGSVFGSRYSVVSLPEHGEDARCRPTSSLIAHRSSFSLLPTPYSLLPTPYSLLPTPYSLLPAPRSNCNIRHLQRCTKSGSPETSRDGKYCKTSTKRARPVGQGR